jgi:hypothetical protein
VLLDVSDRRDERALVKDGTWRSASNKVMVERTSGRSELSSRTRTDTSARRRRLDRSAHVGPRYFGHAARPSASRNQAARDRELRLVGRIPSVGSSYPYRVMMKTEDKVRSSTGMVCNDTVWLPNEMPQLTGVKCPPCPPPFPQGARPRPVTGPMVQCPPPR